MKNSPSSGMEKFRTASGAYSKGPDVANPQGGTAGPSRSSSQQPQFALYRNQPLSSPLSSPGESPARTPPLTSSGSGMGRLRRDSLGEREDRPPNTFIQESSQRSLLVSQPSSENRRLVAGEDPIHPSFDDPLTVTRDHLMLEQRRTLESLQRTVQIRNETEKIQQEVLKAAWKLRSKTREIEERVGRLSTPSQDTGTLEGEPGSQAGIRVESLPEGVITVPVGDPAIPEPVLFGRFETGASPDTPPEGREGGRPEGPGQPPPYFQPEEASFSLGQDPPLPDEPPEVLVEASLSGPKSHISVGYNFLTRVRHRSIFNMGIHGRVELGHDQTPRVSLELKVNSHLANQTYSPIIPDGKGKCLQFEVGLFGWGIKAERGKILVETPSEEKRGSISFHRVGLTTPDMGVNTVFRWFKGQLPFSIGNQCSPALKLQGIRVEPYFLKVSGQPFYLGGAIHPGGEGLLRLHSSRLIPTIKLEGDMVFSRATDDRRVAPKFHLEGQPGRNPNEISFKLDKALEELKGLGTGVSAMRKSQTEAFNGSSPSYRERWLGKSVKLGLFSRLSQIETCIKEEASKVSNLVEKATDQQERCCEHHKEAMGRLQDSVDGLPASQELMSGTSWFLIARARSPIISVVILSLVGGVAFVVTDYLYLKARQRRYSSVVVWYLLRENLRFFFLMGMTLASFNLAWNFFQRRPLNEKWINLSGGLLGGTPFLAGELDQLVAERSILGIDFLGTSRFILSFLIVVYGIRSGKMTPFLQNKVQCLGVVFGWLLMWKLIPIIRTTLYTDSPLDLSPDRNR